MGVGDRYIDPASGLPSMSPEQNTFTANTDPGNVGRDVNYWD